jgi:hypothetical protein
MSHEGKKGLRMPQHRLRAAQAPLAIVLALGFAAACGPAEKAGTTAKTASAPAKPNAASAAPAPNGVEKLRAAEIVSRARKATASARSLRMRGSVRDGKERYTLDFRFAGKTKATGWVQNGKQRMEFTRIGKEVYLKGNDAFWRSAGGKAAVQLFSGKYLKTTTKDPDFKDMAAFTDRTALLNEAMKSEGAWKKGKAGPSFVSLTGAAGDEIQVATQGKPYVLVLDGGPGNRIEYLAYEQPVDARRPPAGTVVDGDAFS